MKVNIQPIRENFIWFLLIFFSWLPILSYTVGNYKGVSIGLYGTVVLLVVFILEMLIRRQRISMIMLYFVCVVLFVMGGTFLKRPYMLAGDMRDYIYLAMILLMFGLSLNKRLTDIQIHFLYVFPYYLTFIMIFFALFPSSYDLADYKNPLYFKFQNPNILSFVLLNMIIFLILGYMDERKKKYLIAMWLNFVMLVLTHSRSSLLAVLFFLLFYIIRNKGKKIKFVPTIIISLVPIIVVYFFVGIGAIEGFSLFGKSGVSGREAIWKYAVHSLENNKQFALFGKGTYMNDCFNSVYNNSHNAYMQLICNFGLPLFSLVLICIIILNVKAGKYIHNAYTFVCYFASCAILINCSFETHIADAIIGLTFMWVVLYWINISKGKEYYDNNGKTFDC